MSCSFQTLIKYVIKFIKVHNIISVNYVALQNYVPFGEGTGQVAILLRIILVSALCR